MRLEARKTMIPAAGWWFLRPAASHWKMGYWSSRFRPGRWSVWAVAGVRVCQGRERRSTLAVSAMWGRVVRTASLMAWGTLLVAGCGAPAQDSHEPRAVEESPAGTSVGETWDAVFAGNSKIGHAHTVARTVRADSELRTQIRGVTVLKMVRGGQTAEMRIEVESNETIAGALRSFWCQTLVGPTPIRIEGQLENGRLVYETDTLGKRLQDSIPWDESGGGFFATEQSLRRQPMQPGERRRLTALIPDVNSVRAADVSLRAVGQESTALMAETRRLLKIEATVTYGSQPIEMIYWVDSAGEVWKSYVEILDQTTYRTTKTEALAETQVIEFDWAQDLIVPVENPLVQPHGIRKAVYRVQLEKGDPAAIFPSGASQQVVSLDARTARITVRAIRPTVPEAVLEEPPPQAAELAANNLIQSDDPLIRELAESIAADQQDPWQLCVALERWVHEQVHAKNFSQGFATAADVIRSREGDCTEHAVLLAALCRARAVPARVVVGLVYSSRDQGFAFHMWNEVWVNDRWVPLDATLGLEGIGAAHLKLGHAAMSLRDAGDAVRGVLAVLRQLNIQVLETEKSGWEAK